MVVMRIHPNWTDALWGSRYALGVLGAGCASSQSLDDPGGARSNRSPCEAVIDLNARGTPLADGSRVFVLDRPIAPERTTWTLPHCSSWGHLPLSFVTAFRYTAQRSAELYFAVVDVNPGQPLSLGAMLEDRCEAGGVAMACGYHGEGQWARLATDIYSGRVVAAGESVVLLVGSALPVSNAAAPFGRFEVRVSELPSRGEGESCGPRVASCGGGLTCSRGLDPRCVAAGGLSQACRADGTCDPGLACNSVDRCVRALEVGDDCLHIVARATCPPTTHCIGDDAAMRCVADGAVGGRCRTAEPRCDEGLACDGRDCRLAASEGEVCDGIRACERGTGCAYTGPRAGRCVRDGEVDGRCDRDSIRCGPELACTWRESVAPRCLRAVASGAVCDVMHGVSACVGGACVAGRCVPDGASGGACRPRASACDAGLGCSSAGQVCRPIVGIGARCTNLSVCAAGSTCRSDGYDGDPQCIADGANTGRCRLATPACDSGLACSNGGDSSLEGRCLPEVSPGLDCAGVSGRFSCPTGSVCTDYGTCVRIGQEDGPCRESPPYCDGTLWCLPGGGIDGSTCYRYVVEGAACSPSGPLCAPGTSCASGPPGTTSRCAAAGTTLGGACRRTAPVCDAGMVCTLFDNTCVLPVFEGGACDLRETADRCVVGASCLPDGAGGGRCVRDGISGGRCRLAVPACDDGLACTGLALAAASRCR